MDFETVPIVWYFLKFVLIMKEHSHSQFNEDNIKNKWKFIT